MKRIFLIAGLIIVLIGILMFILSDSGLVNYLNPKDDSTATTTNKAGPISYDFSSSTPKDKLTIDKKLETRALNIINQTPGNKEIEKLYLSIKNDISNLNNWIQLGILKEEIKDYEGARQVLEFASQLNPKNFISYQNLGDLYGFYLKDPIKAEQNYLKSIENDLTNIDAYLNLSDVYWSGAKEERAKIEGLLLRGIQVNLGDNQMPLMGRLSRYYEEIGDIKNAIVYYEKIYTAHPENKAIKDEIDRLKSLQ